MVIQTYENYETIAKLSQQIEEIRGLEPNSIANQYKQMFDLGRFSALEAKELLLQHLQVLEKPGT